MDQDLTHREKSAGDASPAIGLLPSRWHYAWVIVAVTFAVVVVSAGVRATPGVLIVPLEAVQRFGTVNRPLRSPFYRRPAEFTLAPGSEAQSWAHDRRDLANIG